MSKRTVRRPTEDRALASLQRQGLPHPGIQEKQIRRIVKDGGQVWVIYVRRQWARRPIIALEKHWRASQSDSFINWLETREIIYAKKELVIEAHDPLVPAGHATKV